MQPTVFAQEFTHADVEFDCWHLRSLPGKSHCGDDVLKASVFHVNGELVVAAWNYFKLNEFYI